MPFCTRVLLDQLTPALLSDRSLLKTSRFTPPFLLHHFMESPANQLELLLGFGRFGEPENLCEIWEGPLISSSTRFTKLPTHSCVHCNHGIWEGA